MFYNTSYKIILLAICFLRISAFGFLIHEAFDALFGCLFKFLKVYFHFSNLAICRQQLVQLISVGFHCFLYIGLLQAMGYIRATSLSCCNTINDSETYGILFSLLSISSG